MQILTVVELCLRLGNLNFMEIQLEGFKYEVLKNDVQILDKLSEDFRANVKQISKKIVSCICSEVFNPCMFEQVYNNLTSEVFNQCNVKDF